MYRHYEISLAAMAYGSWDYEHGLWKAGEEICNCNECRSFYVADWAYAGNLDLVQISPYGTISWHGVNMIIATIVFGLCLFIVGIVVGNTIASRYFAALLIVNGYKNYKGRLFPHRYSDETVARAKKIVPDIK